MSEFSYACRKTIATINFQLKGQRKQVEHRDDRFPRVLDTRRDPTGETRSWRNNLNDPSLRLEPVRLSLIRRAQDRAIVKHNCGAHGRLNVGTIRELPDKWRPNVEV